MSSKLIGILSVGAALAHTEIGAVRERARAQPRELRDGLRGEVGREHTAVAPRSVTPSCQSCHRAVVRGSCRCVAGAEASDPDSLDPLRIVALRPPTRDSE